MDKVKLYQVKGVAPATEKYRYSRNVTFGIVTTSATKAILEVQKTYPDMRIDSVNPVAIVHQVLDVPDEKY